MTPTVYQIESYLSIKKYRLKDKNSYFCNLLILYQISGANDLPSLERNR